MEDNIDDEKKEFSANIPPENSTEEKISAAGAETLNINQENKDMEVHHHAHHEANKNWKSYFWEFIMLFFAVFCGFLAEYQLEHVIEHQREKVYIHSMLEDVVTDLTNIESAITENNIRIAHLDSLADLCLNDVHAKTEGFEFYKHYIYGLYHPDFVTLTERTTSQLKNAGGMRLIRNKLSADHIILYDGMTKKLSDQQAYYELYQNSSINLASKIFNFQRFGMGTLGPKLESSTDKQEYFKLISADKALLTEFGNTVVMYEGVVQYYNDLLLESKEKGKVLIATLKKEYHLE